MCSSCGPRSYYSLSSLRGQVCRQVGSWYEVCRDGKMEDWLILLSVAAIKVFSFSLPNTAESTCIPAATSFPPLPVSWLGGIVRPTYRMLPFPISKYFFQFFLLISTFFAGLLFNGGEKRCFWSWINKSQDKNFVNFQGAF